jgi:hypothetical protein
MGRSAANRKRIENDFTMKERQYRFWNLVTKSQLKATLALRRMENDSTTSTCSAMHEKHVTLIACDSSLTQLIVKEHGKYDLKEMKDVLSIKVHGLNSDLRQELA